MALVRWARFYCWVPLGYKEEILRKGVRPKRIFGGEVVRLFPSRSSVEKEIRGRYNRILLSVEAKKLDSGLITSVDFNNWFYRGIIPSGAISIIKEKGRRNGHKPHIFQTGRFL